MKLYQSKINGHCVTLRFLETRDASFLMELNNDLEIAQYVVGNPKQVTIEEQMQWMERAMIDSKTKRFIVEYDGLSVGTVILSDIDLFNRTANVNIKLQSSARGRGIGKQSILLALQFCFEVLEVFCVTAHVLSVNKASLSLFESCGFTNEGILRSRVVKNGKRHDLASFSIVRDEI